MISQSRSAFNGLAAILAGLMVGVVTVLSVANMPASADTPAAPAGTAPKAYVGLFKDNAVAVFDTGTDRVLTTIPIPAGPHGLVMTPDGSTVFASSDGDSKVSVIDTATDKVTNTIEVGKSPHGLAITPDGKKVLAAVFGAGQVVFIDPAGKTVIGQVPVASPHNITVSPDGKMAYVASQAPGAFELAILDVTKNSAAGAVPLDKSPRALNFSPDGKELYFTLAGSDAVQVLDPATNKIVAQVPVGASPHHPLFTADGKEALVVSQGPGELEIINPATNTVSGMVKVGTMPHWIAITPDGGSALVTNEGSNDLSIVDLKTNKVTATVPVGNAPRKIVVQPAPTSAAPAQVAITNFAFAPQTITIAPGQSVVWVNNDSVAHSVTAADGTWGSADLAQGQSYTQMFAKPGKYAYKCGLHPYMQGVVMVQ